MADDEGTPDSLFGPSNTPAPDQPSPAEPSSAPAAPSPAFVPRAVKRRPARPRTSAATLLARAAPRAASPEAVEAPAPPPPTASSSSTPAQPPKLSQQERDRLETILSTVETGLSDYGLSVHRGAGGQAGAGGLLERFKEGRECAWAPVLPPLSHSRGAQAFPRKSRRANSILSLLTTGLHISQILALPPVRALTGSLLDLQKALRLRESSIVKVRTPLTRRGPQPAELLFIWGADACSFGRSQIGDSGFQVGRKEQPDVQRLETLEAADWDETVVYLVRCLSYSRA